MNRCDRSANHWPRMDLRRYFSPSPCKRAASLLWSLPLYFRIMLVALTGITSMTSAVVLLRRNQSPADFWTEYSPALYGQSSPYTCAEIPQSDTPRLCRDQRPGPILSTLEIALCNRDGCSRRTIFESVDSVTIGRVALYWGVPDFRVQGQVVYVSWPKLRVSAVAQTASGRFSYFLPVSLIYVQDT